MLSTFQGNAVSWIQSVFHPYGSNWVAEGTGILFNNRMNGFSLDPKSPNFIAPGKRPVHTLNAWIATDQSGALKYVGGTPGANVQVQSNFQILVNLVDLGLDVQQACEAPRWQHVTEGGHSGYDEGTCGVLGMENRFPKHVIEELKAKGHIIGDLGPWGKFNSFYFILSLFPLEITVLYFYIYHKSLL
jgi:gamma-glutamyltranspeptidase / glutathione hydrolase